MHKKFTERGFADYVYWQTQDKKTLNKINRLLQDIDRKETATTAQANHYGDK